MQHAFYCTDCDLLISCNGFYSHIIIIIIIIIISIIIDAEIKVTLSQ